MAGQSNPNPESTNAAYRQGYADGWRDALRPATRPPINTWPATITGIEDRELRLNITLKFDEGPYIGQEFWMALSHVAPEETNEREAASQFEFDWEAYHRIAQGRPKESLIGQQVAAQVAKPPQVFQIRPLNEING